MNTELDIYRGAPLADRQQYALTIARAKAILPSNLRAADEQETAARAFLIMETGDMLGLHPMAALAGVNVIEGKPALSSGLMSAVIRDAGHKLHITEEGTIEEGNYKATAELIREDDPDHPFRSTWTPHRAQRAGLCKYEEQPSGLWKVTAVSQQGKPLPWQNYTESLCKSRAISEVARDGAQDALLGMRYTPEELESGVEGDVIVVAEAEPEQAATPRRRATNGRQGTKRKTSTAGTTTSVPMDTPETPQEPTEDIVDADVVEEPQEDPAEAAEREERARIAAEQEKAARDTEAAEQAAEAEAARAKREAEVARQQERLREQTAARTEKYIDPATGIEYATSDEMVAAMRERRHAEKQAQEAPPQDDEPSAGPNWDDAPVDQYQLARGEEWDREKADWMRLVEAATTEPELREVWDESARRNERDTDLGSAIIEKRQRILAARA